MVVMVIRYGAGAGALVVGRRLEVEGTAALHAAQATCRRRRRGRWHEDVR